VASRRLVVNVEVRAGDEIIALDEVDRTQVIGFDHAAGNVGQVVDQAAQCLEIAFGFEQGLGREDNLFAGITQVVGQTNPVGSAQLLAA
jgi:hypothetical protein